MVFTMKISKIITLLGIISFISFTPDFAKARVTVEETLKYAFEYSPNIKSAKESREESVYNIKEARAGYFPSIGVWAGGGYQQNDDLFTRSNKLDNDVVSYYDAGIQIDQMLWDGGKTRAEVRAKTEELKYKSWQLMDAANSLAYSAISSHIDILRRQNLVKLAINNVKEHKRILALLGARVRQGLSSQGDLDLARSRLERAEATLNLHQQGLETANITYLKVTGRTAPTDLANVSFPKVQYQNEEQAKNISVNKNMRIQSAMVSIESALAEVDGNKANFYPKFSLNGGSNFIDKDYMGNNKELTWSVALNMQWNIFKGGADVSRVKASTAKVKELRQDLISTMDEVSQELHTSFIIVKHAREQANLYNKSAQSAKKAKQNYTIQFEVGKKDLLSVLDAESEYFFSLVENEISKTDALLGEYRILAITGELLDSIGINSAQVQKDMQNKSNKNDLVWNFNP